MFSSLVSSFQNQCSGLQDNGSIFVTMHEDGKWEKLNIRSPLFICEYHAWTVSMAATSYRSMFNGTDTARTRSGSVVIVPYTAGLRENLARIYKPQNISLISKLANTHGYYLTPRRKSCLKTRPVAPFTDSAALAVVISTSGIRPPTGHQAIWAQEVVVDGNFKSSVSGYAITQSLRVCYSRVRILGREQRALHYQVKEGIWIRWEQPTLNREQRSPSSNLYDTSLQGPRQTAL